jgi:hypothetical protein
MVRRRIHQKRGKIFRCHIRKKIVRRRIHQKKEKMVRRHIRKKWLDVVYTKKEKK